MQISVYVSHREYLIAESLSRVISGFLNFSCSGFSTKAEIPKGLPLRAVFLIDFGILKDGSFELISDILTVYPQSRIIALGEPRFFHALKEKGCWSVVDPSCSISDLEKYLRAFSQSMEPFLYPYSKMVADKKPESPFQILSQREQETLDLLARGYKNSEIAIAMGIKAQTVGTNIARMCEKLGVVRKQELIFLRWRYEDGNKELECSAQIAHE